MGKFSGDDALSIKKWLEDFDDVAKISNWSEIYKITYAKSLLEGSAERFILYEKNKKTWALCKQALVNDSGETVDSNEIHKRLVRGRKKSDESYYEFVYRMMEIAAQANVETTTVIQYNIEGITDDATNKVILYGAETIEQLKMRLVQYQQMKADSRAVV